MKPRIVFMGTPDFAVPSLQKLIEAKFAVVGVVCQPDRPRGRSGLPQAPPVKKEALAHNIPVLQPQKVKTDEFFQALAAFKPDLVVTAAYGRILPPPILALPTHGCLNVHASLLPAYRGAAPIQWALIQGEKETGITIMRMDEGMDTGDILRQEKIALDETIDAGILSQKLALLGAAMLPDAILDYIAGRIKPKPQDDTKASRAPMLRKEDGEIDWTKSAQAIHDLIRGTYPWPGAYTWCDDKRMKIHRARINDDPDLNQQAKDLNFGTVCLCGPETISVVCGEGVIDLIEVQTASGRRMHCKDCAHNYRLGQQMGGN